MSKNLLPALIDYLISLLFFTKKSKKTEQTKGKHSLQIHKMFCFSVFLVLFVFIVFTVWYSLFFDFSCLCLRLVKKHRQDL